MTSQEFQNFLKSFYKNDFGEQRMGQAFINHFKVAGTNPEIFYEKDDSKALLAMQKFVKYEDIQG